ncbi:hypothetical protein GT045_31855 [Streptomyces sp. SID486]|uniref:hypothetical protein n=1 Tax=unclassified Streptomyces TaxID=2593676 RepID=UPI001367EDD0|nr:MULTISPECIES: hypothetical protein [unclassified Streptomyces]MYW14420.1 hypothetical protein [Streptomyces sp. SID2955]MYW48349.1 hypothetical protein [Streptomyces sp. SID161]MYX99273.1 hypothetical protein [Streptomyces sp. SID486]
MNDHSVRELPRQVPALLALPRQVPAVDRVSVPSRHDDTAGVEADFLPLLAGLLGRLIV